MTGLLSWLRALERPGRRADLFLCAIGAVICTGLAGYFRIHTDLPGSLAGDHIFLLTSAKEFINGHGFRLDSQLGFPDERDSLFFPSFDLSYRLMLWLLAHLSHNPFRVVHGLYAIGVATMYACAYWTLRRFGVRTWLAAFGSLASILTAFFAIRGYNHDALSLYFSAPLGLGLAMLIGIGPYDGQIKRLLKDPYVLAAILVVATSGLYYAFYTVMLCLFAATAAAMGQRRISPVLAALAVTVPIFVLLVFSGFGLDLAAALNPQVAQPRRAPYEQLVYGLDLAASAYPFSFLTKVAAGVAQAQVAYPTAFAAEGVGEWPSPFLTLGLFATPLILAACLLRPKPPNGEAEDPRVRFIAFCCALILFAMLFAARGGIGFLFNLAVTPVIRADSRIMPFLVMAVILMICVSAEMTSASPRVWIRWGGVGLAGAIMLASAWQGRWTLYRIQLRELAKPDNQMVRVSYPAMLAAKDRAGLHTVLQLPVASWAEAPDVRNFQPYNHQLAYIYDRPGSTTRWSYGANEKQRAFGLVSFMASDPGPLDVRARLLGFDGVLIEKPAYDTSELDKLQAGVVAGGACRLYEDDHQALYTLAPRC